MKSVSEKTEVKRRATYTRFSSESIQTILNLVAENPDDVQTALTLAAETLGMKVEAVKTKYSRLKRDQKRKEALKQTDEKSEKANDKRQKSLSEVVDMLVSYGINFEHIDGNICVLETVIEYA